MKTAALVVLVAATPAFAQPTVELVPTCVVIAVEHDELPEAERPAARMLVVRALEHLDQLVVETGCQETFEVSHQRAGAALQVRMASSHARRKLTVPVRDEMLHVYSRMAKEVLEAAAPAPVAVEAARPTAIEAPDITMYERAPDAPSSLTSGTWYAMLGLGMHDGEGARGFALGYRRGAGRVKADLAMSITGSEGSTTVAFRGQALYLKTPQASSSVYYGMGLSHASTKATTASGMRESSGARIESTLGFEFARTRSGRLYLEASFALPFYDVAGRHPVAFVTSFGAGL